MGSERAKLSGKGRKDLEMDIKKTSLFGDTEEFFEKWKKNWVLVKCWDNFWAVKDRVVTELADYHLLLWINFRICRPP